MFHRVVDQIPEGPLYDIHYTRDNLEKLLGSLQDRGYETVTFGDLLDREVLRKPVILTFDDGYEDNYTYLLPLLRKYRMKAVIYLLGDRSVRTNTWDLPQGAVEAPLMGKEQILEMAESGLVEFGAHSMTHAKLTQLPPELMEAQIHDCKTSLEKLLKREVFSFAYPYGLLNERVKEAVAQAGYRFGIAVEWGPDQFGDDLMQVRRICLSSKAGTLEFLWKTSFLFPPFRRLQKSLKAWFKQPLP